MHKATTRLETFDEEKLDVMLRHPGQWAVARDVSRLIEDLRRCETHEDLVDVQRDLLTRILAVDERRNACRGAEKRLRGGKRVVDTVALPPGRDVEDPEEWSLENYVFTRFGRQLRSVGDALAWRVFGFDRRPIVALSRNQSPGPMWGKEGLEAELGHLEEFWKETGRFALLHDVTNCLRISDVSEFREGVTRVVEVKAGGRSRTLQNRRAAQAVAALTEGGALPGPWADEYFFEAPTRYKANVAQLRDVLENAHLRGCAGLKLPQGRALVAMDMLTFARDPEDDVRVDGAAEWQKARSGAIRRAGIADAEQSVRGLSFDSAARSPVMVPFGIYPLEPETVGLPT